MTCPHCLCETQTPEAHPPGYPACLEVQRLRRQLELVPPVLEYKGGLGRFFHDPTEADKGGPRA